MIDLRRLAASGVLLQTLLGAPHAVAAAPPATALGIRADKGKSAAAEARDKLAANSRSLLELSAQRKQLQSALTGKRRELKQRVAAGAAAFKRYQSAKLAKKVTAADAAQLEKARAEYAAAADLGERIGADTRALRALEERIAKQLEVNQSALDAVKSAASEANASATELKGLAKAAMDGSQAAAQKAASSSTPWLGAAQVPARNYAAFQAKAAKEDAAVKQRVAAAKASLASVSGPKGTPLKQCDIRNVDWKNFAYSAFPSDFKNGGAEHTSGDATESWQVSGIEFFDLDADGSAEALVSGVYASLGLTAYQRPYLFVLSRDQACGAVEVGSVEGMGMCSELLRQGRTLVVADCGVPPVEYQLIKGALKVTKGTPQQ